MFNAFVNTKISADLTSYVYDYNYLGGVIHLKIESDFGKGNQTFGQVLLRELICPLGYFISRFPSFLCERCPEPCTRCDKTGKCAERRQRALDETGKKLRF